MKKSFTLVELLVVLVIIGILVALILPNFFRGIRQADTRECSSNLRAIDTAIQMCFTETRDWGACDDIAGELVAGGYLEDLPACAFGVGYTIVPKGGNLAGNEVDKSAHFADWTNPSDHL